MSEPIVEESGSDPGQSTKFRYRILDKTKGRIAGQIIIQIFVGEQGKGQLAGNLAFPDRVEAQEFIARYLSNMEEAEK